MSAYVTGRYPHPDHDLRECYIYDPYPPYEPPPPGYDAPKRVRVTNFNTPAPNNSEVGATPEELSNTDALTPYEPKTWIRHRPIPWNEQKPGRRMKTVYWFRPERLKPYNEGPRRLRPRPILPTYRKPANPEDLRGQHVHRMMPPDELQVGDVNKTEEELDAELKPYCEERGLIAPQLDQPIDWVEEPNFLRNPQRMSGEWSLPGPRISKNRALWEKMKRRVAEFRKTKFVSGFTPAEAIGYILRLLFETLKDLIRCMHADPDDD